MTVGAGATYDDNLFRLPAGQTPTGLRSASRSDFFWNAFVDGQAYLPVSRQVLRAGLTLATNGYQNYSFLNYQAVNGSAAWDWRIGSRFSGTLSYTQLQALSSFIDLRSFVRNINTVRIASAENEFWMLPDWHLTAGVASTRVDNSDEALSFAKLDETAADAGIKYVTYAQNYVKLYWREAWGKYPDQQVVAGSFFDNRYDQTDVTLEYFQAPTGASQVIARLAYTERRSPNLPQRNFSGPTGRLSWVYAATGKLGFEALGRREIGAYTDLVSNYIVTDAVGVTPYWRVTGKLRVDASVERQRRDYRGDPSFVLTNQPAEHDLLTFWRLSTTYDLAFRWKAVAGWQHSSRSSNVHGLGFSEQSVYASVQYKWD